MGIPGLPDLLASPSGNDFDNDQLDDMDDVIPDAKFERDGADTDDEPPSAVSP